MMRIHLATAGLVVFAVSLTAADRVPANGGDIEITPLVHASVQLEFGGKVIQVDPWSAVDLSKAKPADLILITDDPIHHLDPRAIQQLRKPGAPVVMPATGKEKVPDGIVLPNGEHTVAADIAIEALPAYDLTPGDPPHPKGKANGYVITLGGKRILCAGVTQCVPELRAQKNIEVAFIPMNIPPDRMSPQEAADCVKALHPKIVYLSHYDQDYAGRLTNPRATPRPLPSGLTVAQTVDVFRNAMKNSGIEFRDGLWYPAPR
jgi:L-ascorbate metabolism protein UlaG (beta-lactamase superfamily)